MQSTWRDFVVTSYVRFVKMVFQQGYDADIPGEI